MLTGQYMSDVGSRTPRQSLLQRKASHQGESQTPGDDRNYEGYYGEDGWWEEDGYHHFGSYDAAYYEEWQTEGRAEDIFEVDLYSMVFVLDENLSPKDMYNGFEFNEKSFLFTIEAEDVAPNTPAAWKSRPLKIHPEPPLFRKDVASTPPPRSGAATDANTGGSNTPIAAGGRTPRQKAATPPKVETPKETLPPQTPPQRSVENEEDSESGEDPGKTAKIHISNRQLEHLKQKMQVLKQRRASLPDKEKAEKDKENEKAQKEEKTDKTENAEKNEKTEDKKKADEASSSAQKRIEGTVHSNCPGAHGLSLFKTPARGWWCSVCEKEHEKGSAFYGCRKCDYDECEACAMTPRPAKAPAVQAEKEPEAAETGGGNATNSNSTPTPTKAKGATKVSAPAPTPKKTSSSSSSSSSSGESQSSKTRSAPRKKETKTEKSDKKEANLKEKSVKKSNGKREAEKRKAAKVKVKRKTPTAKKSEKNQRRPSKTKSSKSSDASRSEEKAKKKKKPRETKRAASDPKLVPRKPKEAKEPERWEPKRRKEEKEASPKKKPARSRSRDDSSSEEPPKKRAANALTVAEPRAPVSLTRAAARREEKPRADEAARGRRNATEVARGRPGGDGGDLLRRVLRANATQAGGTRAKEEPRATLVPTRKDESSGEESAPRGAATLRPPQDRGIKKALDGRKSRRV